MSRSSLTTYMIMAAAIIAAAYLIVGHYGLIPGLDFGCGQYYYTDIPEWQKYFSVEGVRDKLPKWVYYVLFFGWGYIVYRLWRKIDQ